MAQEEIIKASNGNKRKPLGVVANGSGVRRVLIGLAMLHSGFAAFSGLSPGIRGEHRTIMEIQPPGKTKKDKNRHYPLHSFSRLSSHWMRRTITLSKSASGTSDEEARPTHPATRAYSLIDVSYLLRIKD